jgi:hypothetical protein
VAVGGLLLEKVHFFIDRSTVGTSRSVASVMPKSSAGPKLKLFAMTLVGNTSRAVLYFVAMSF